MELLPPNVLCGSTCERWVASILDVQHRYEKLLVGAWWLKTPICLGLTFLLISAISRDFESFLRVGFDSLIKRNHICLLVGNTHEIVKRASWACLAGQIAIHLLLDVMVELFLGAEPLLQLLECRHLLLSVFFGNDSRLEHLRWFSCPFHKTRRFLFLVIMSWAEDWTLSAGIYSIDLDQQQEDLPGSGQFQILFHFGFGSDFGN